MDGSRILPGFEDFDKAEVYKRGEEYIVKADALNFAIEYDSDIAVAALGLNLSSVQELLRTKIDPTRTRWINLWCPERQKHTVSALADHYGFSPRLIALMTSDPDRPVVAPMENHQSRWQRWKERQSFESHPEDVELSPSIQQPASHNIGLDLNHYRIINEVWYFCSVDWGSRYLCVGYNSLSQLGSDEAAATPHSPQEKSPHTQDKPDAKRLWTWLILCDDRTIITINENPFLDRTEPTTAVDKTKVQVLRRNLKNVFKQLSKSNDEWIKQNPIMTVPVRAGLLKINEGEVTASDAPSLLFHYLFDDWYTSYSLVAKREHQYGVKLAKLREIMFEEAKVGHIKELHQIGQQLSVLKKIYRSYVLIIERILDRQKPVDMASSTQLLNESIDESTEMLTAQTRTYAVSLSSAAIVRFERLRDRVQLYALSEIQECIDEKEALASLNFNLITLKQSDAVERLTRITILLAKVTILFMPVSLMTAYFSVQIDDLQGVYTSTTYWACFAVIMALSFLFLVIFGKLSNTMEGKTIYRSMTQAFIASSRKWLNSKQKRKTASKTI